MNKTKPVLFYQIVIIVSCIVLSWGFSKFALFTQYKFRELINWENRYHYEADWKGTFEGTPANEGKEVEKEKNQKGSLLKYRGRTR